MAQVSPALSPDVRRGEPVWEIAELFPEQGAWLEEDYLNLDTNRLVEFDNGIVEVLPLPTKSHQLIVLFIYRLLDSFFAGLSLGGKVLVAPYRVRVAPGRYREPDVLYLTAEQHAKSVEQFTDWAELVVEVVSRDNPQRDYADKRKDYAVAGVPEYWIVDSDREEILVLRLETGVYVEQGRFAISQQATSQRFPGLSVSVQDVMNSCI